MNIERETHNKSEYYMRNASILQNWNDIRIADMNELYEIPTPALKNITLWRWL